MCILIFFFNVLWYVNTFYALGKVIYTLPAIIVGSRPGVSKRYTNIYRTGAHKIY